MIHSQPLARLCMSLIVLSSVSNTAWGADKPSNKPVLPKLKETSSSSGKNVNELFRDGKELFDAGKFGDATLAFSKILKKFPEHQPTILLYARASYKINKFSEARYLFARVKPDILDAESAYEYGQSFYMANQFAPALMAFQRVPDNHSLSDLSRFYGGVSAIKLKQYELAEDLLTKALVLPEKEARSRASYLKHVGRLLDMQQKQSLAVERANEKNMQQRELRVAKIGTPPVPSTETSDANKGFEHKGFLSVDRNARLGALILNQTQVFGDSQPEIEGGEFSEEQLAFERQYFVSAGIGHIFPVGQPTDGKHPAMGLNLRAKGLESYVSGTVVTPYTTDTDNITRQQRTRTAGGFARAAEIKPYVWFENPIQPDMWFYLKAGYELFKLMTPSSQEGKIVALLGGGKKADNFDAEANLTYEQLSIDSKASINTVRAKVASSYKWMPTLKTAISGIHESLDYVDESIDGPSSSTRAQLSTSLDLPLDSELSVSGTADYQLRNLVHGVVNYGEVAADGHVETIELKFKTAPLPWWTLGLRTSIIFATWTTDEQEQQNSFDRTAPYQTTESELTTAFIFSF